MRNDYLAGALLPPPPPTKGYAPWNPKSHAAGTGLPG